MRVLLAGQTYLPTTNGPAVFTTGLAEALAANGHDVLAVVPSPDGRSHEARRNGVVVRALPSLVLARSGVAVTVFPNARVRRLLRAFGPDVVHIQDHYPTSRAVLAESLALKAPVVGTNHFLPANLVFQLPVPPSAQGPLERVLWWTVRSVFRRVAVATAPSEAAASALLSALGLHGVRVISCGVDVARFAPRPPDARRRLRARFGLPVDATVALYVGRVDRDKNLDVLLDAWPLTSAADLLVIAGRGLHLDALRRHAARLRLAGRTRFLGYVPDDALPGLYAAADLFVMPGRVELLSIATLEAMASGLPVAAARAGALPELVTPGTHGTLFDPTDPGDVARALERLASRREDWPRMGHANRARAEEHRLEHVRTAFEALYREVLARRPAFS